MDTLPPLPASPTFKGAGCVFHDTRYILAGYQKTSTTPVITGIGGKREAGETPTQTALRETLEELFGFPHVSPYLITSLEVFFPPQKIIKNRKYHMLTYSFHDLDRILYFLAFLGFTSPLFDTFPTCLTELLFHRKVLPTSEITHLALLPFVNHPRDSPFICSAFLRDIELILRETDTAYSQEEDHQTLDS